MPGEGMSGYTARSNFPYNGKMPYHKGKVRKGKLYASSLTWDFGKTKGSRKSGDPGSHRINGDNMLMPKGYEKLSRKGGPSVPKKKLKG